MTARSIVYIDGGSRGNPGPAGYGVSVQDDDGRVVEELTGAIGIATNNGAEYRGLIAALEYLVANGRRDVIIRSDSQLLTRQMRGEYRVRQPELQALHARARDLASRLGEVCYEHVPRERNRRADELANAAMDGAGDRGKAPAQEGAGDPGRTPANAAAGPVSRVAVPAALVVSDAARGEVVIGIGIDIEEVARVDDLVRRYGDRFIERIFTEGEAGYCLRRRVPAQHLTARFSAKEAAMKALGTGRAHGVLWRDVEVVRRGGPPQLELHGGARRRFEALGATGALLTMTHSRQLAIAQVALLGR